MLRPVLPKKGRVCTTPISHEPVPDASLKVVFHQQRQKTAALQDASRSPMPKGSAPAFGLRQSSGAFERRVAAPNQRKVSPSPCRVASTAAEDCRTPRRTAFANTERSAPALGLQFIIASRRAEEKKQLAFRPCHPIHAGRCPDRRKLRSCRRT